MKKLLLLLMLTTVLAQAQGHRLRVPEKEHFIINIHLDWADYSPNNHKSNILKDYGLNYNIEAGIKSAISNFIGTEVKIGYEAFPKLEGGYSGFTGSFGVRLVYGYDEEWDYYIGYRASKIYRTGSVIGKTYRWNPALEIKITRSITDNFSGGLRYVYEKAYDQEILGWKVENRNSVYITLEFKLFKL